MGGAAIALPFLGLCLLGITHPTSMLRLIAPMDRDLVLLAVCSLLIVALGAVDDILHLSAKVKFLIQGLVALLFCAAGKTVTMVDLPWLGTVHLGLFFGTVLTMFWLVGVMNAFNLVDGVDGLASSLALIAAFGLGTIAAMNGATFIVVLSLGLAGSLGAFLIFNFHPAKIFLGDTGSLFLGFVLAALSLMGGSRTSGTVMLITPMVVLALPIFDTLTSMARRMLRGQNPFWGDRRHTHHRLMDLGLSQRQVALVMGGVSLLCTVAAICAQLFTAERKVFTIAIGLAGFTMVGVAYANGYLRLRHAMRVAHCRARNNRLAAFANYAALALGSPAAKLGTDDVLELICKELGLDFLEVSDSATGEILCSLECPDTAVLTGGEPDPIEIVRVDDAGHRMVIVRYRLGHMHQSLAFQDEDARDKDRLEHEDVASCLARLFNKTRLNPMELPVSVTNNALG